jgi:magnesium chelatase family protein
VTYPARFQLVAAMNPCRCGYLDDPALACSRVPRCAMDYQSKISGPLFDRIDLHVDAPAVKPADLSLPAPAEGTADIAARVAAARQCQTTRISAIPAAAANAVTVNADGELLDAVAAPDAAGKAPLTEAAERMHLSARGWHRILRVGRTHRRSRRCRHRAPGAHCRSSGVPADGAGAVNKCNLAGREQGDCPKMRYLPSMQS